MHHKQVAHSFSGGLPTSLEVLGRGLAHHITSEGNQRFTKGSFQPHEGRRPYNSLHSDEERATTYSLGASEGLGHRWPSKSISRIKRNPALACTNNHTEENQLKQADGATGKIWERILRIKE
ncbi:hypothetical protein VZT92_006822 [Zoarces viviparus]|uniref:Uncharacterized protein n=1 Tax=Zoarces viviparus TaxID=48416 RepID=A0AAW1FSN6_ZOAVI